LIYPLSNVILKKVKTIKKPKFDLTKLNELYRDVPKVEGGSKKGKGGKIDEEEPKNLLSS